MTHRLITSMCGFYRVSVIFLVNCFLGLVTSPEDRSSLLPERSFRSEYLWPWKERSWSSVILLMNL